MHDLNLLLKTLLEYKIDFVIIGGFAAVVHGSSHVTKDLHITMMISEKNIENLRQALKPFDPRHRMNTSHKSSFLEEPRDLSNLKNIYLETTAGILDVISMDHTLGSFDDLQNRALRVPLFGYECLVLSLDDLIQVKAKMKRPKDLIVLEELKALRDHQD